MKKYLSYLFIVFLVSFASCSDDNKENEIIIDEVVPVITVETQDADRVKEATVGLPLTFEVKSGEDVKIEKYTWRIVTEPQNTKRTADETNDQVERLTYTPSAPGKYRVSVDCLLEGGKVYTVSYPEFQVYGKYKFGTFVLNEGNMGSENGSLTFIDRDGNVEGDAYKAVNGTELGNVSQDLFIADNRIYLLSQNGTRNPMGGEFANEGVLVVANAETLEKIVSYDSNVKATLNWASHLAVVDGEIFIRDNKGVYSFTESDKTLTYIEGTKGANKMPIAAIDKKVFVAAGKKVLVIEKGKKEVAKEIEFPSAVSAVAKSHDGKLWVSASAGSAGLIAKVDPSTYQIEKQNEIPFKVSAGWAASSSISAKQDTIYFSNLTPNIYRHVFTTNETVDFGSVKPLIGEHAGIVYNTIAVHPTSGEVYINTIDNYATYKQNNISVINFHGKEPKLSANYKDYTRFPAGIFFPQNFR